MTYNFEQNIHKITSEFIEKRIPTNNHDRELLSTYRKALSEGEKRLPVFEGTEGAGIGYPVLTHYGLATLSIDTEYMAGFYIPRFKELAAAKEMTPEEHHLLIASLLEFALLGCIEAQTLLFQLNGYAGEEDAYISDVVIKRWPNLQHLNRFLTAQSGAGYFENSLPTYEEALAEIMHGYKSKHWIWYIFPQMGGIKGTYSGNSVYYGIHGRMEALQYICHPLLRFRLIQITDAILQTGKSVCEIVSEVDAMKVQSCMKLFGSVSDIPTFKEFMQREHW